MINALRYTEELEKAGFTTEQARISVNAWMDLMNNNFATKTDLKEHHFMTRADLKDFEMKLVAGLSSVEMKFDRRCDELEVKFDKLYEKLATETDKIGTKIEKLELRLTIKMASVMILILGTAKMIDYLL